MRVASSTRSRLHPMDSPLPRPAAIPEPCRSGTSPRDASRQRLLDHLGPIWRLDFSPDGKMLAAATGKVPAMSEPSEVGQVGEIRLWNLGDRAPRARQSRRPRLRNHLGRVLPRWLDPGNRRLRPGREALGGGLGSRVGPLSRATKAGSPRWRSPPTEPSWPPAPTTKRSSSGTRPPAKNSPRSADTPATSTPSRSPPTAPGWSRGASTGPCASGIPTKR